MHAPLREDDLDPVATAEAIIRAGAEPDERRFRFWWDDDAEQIGFCTL